MKKQYISLLLGIIWCCLSAIHAQGEVWYQDPDSVYESTVTDRDGNPIAGAIVYGNEGTVRVLTDRQGRFAIPVPAGSEILIEAPGYDRAVFTAGQEQLVLEKPDFMFSAGDYVNIAFGSEFKATLANAVSVLDPKEYTGFDNVQSVTGIMYGRVPGLYGNSNLRGMGSVLYVIDGMPRDPSYLSISEVEQITFLKDINSTALYGSAAANGVVLITTKRGKPYDRTINVQAYYGVQQPRAIPNYLSSADYMEQHNVARENDGLSPLYDETTINNYRSGNPYRYPNVDYYSDEYLRKVKPYSKVMMDMSGGNRVANYYSNLSWENYGSLIKFGSGKDSRMNNISARGNVDFRISRKIKTSVDAVGYISHDTRPNLSDENGTNSSYWSLASIYRPDRFAPLLPINLIDPELSLLTGRKTDIKGQYLVGGNSSNQYNPIAGMYLGGDYTYVTRNFSFNNRIDFDLDDWVSGMAFHTNISFDYRNSYHQYIRNSYSVYEAVWHPTENRITDLVKYNEDNRTGIQHVGNITGQRRFGAYVMLDYSRLFDGVHQVEGSLLGYTAHNKLTTELQTEKNTHLGLRLAYNYGNKYLVDFSSSLANSVKLHPDNRTGFSPSLGLGWIISSEDFMSKADFVDFLKLKVSGGILKTDALIGGYYLYDDLYVSTGTMTWYGGMKRRNNTTPSFGENRDLFFEKRKDVNIGIEGVFLGRSLSVELNLFRSIHSDIVTKAESIYPSYYTSYSPYVNYNKNEYKGFEAGLTYKRDFGDFSVMVGGTVLYTDSKVLKRDEVWANGYQYRKGSPVDARYGLIADGFFMSEDEIANHPAQAFGSVRPGDIKYLDMNDDGIIDANDETYMGRWQAPWFYTVQLKVSYRNLTLFAIGSGTSGGTGYLGDAAYNNYYWAQGDVKYSAYMLNNWTEATKYTATYPRLSSTANDNNFRASTFWLYKSDYFDLSRVQLTYDISFKDGNKLGIRSLGVFCNASNLVTISKNSGIRTLTIGSEPQYRSYSLGVRMSF